MIKVEKVSYYYPTIQALYNVSFSILPNTITALVGPNGAGKSTMMRCLAGLDIPFNGKIELNGIDVINNPRDLHNHIGFLQDLFGLYEELTVYQCFYYHAEAQKIAKLKRNEIIESLAEELNLTSQLFQLVGNLSRGQRQRVAIAQAIIHNPKVLILDEPASGLDPEARYDLSDLLLKLQKRGITILVSSHILSELEAYSTHMLILREGRIVEHCSIASETSSLNNQKIIQLKLTTDYDGIEELLKNYNEVMGFEQEDINIYKIEFSGDETALQQLLEHLIHSAVPVYSFTEIQQTMHNVYLDKVKENKNES